MKKALQQRYDFIISYFSEHNPNATSELTFNNGFELLVAVVLSAQCTDKRVNMVTPALFAKYPTPKAMAQASVEDIYELIKSISYPNNKAAHLNGLAKKLVEDFDGKIPDNMQDLQKLPGVGRKTANVILAIIYNQPAMAVDTHIFRVANRIGLVENANTPERVEKQLVSHFPANVIPVAHHWLLLHGRYICLARAPQCNKCGINSVCQYFKENNKQQ